MRRALLVKGKPDESKRRCFDCYHCQAAVTWWCTNRKAVDARGTAIPGIKNCPYWEPVEVKEETSFFKRLVEGYIEIEGGKE